MVLLLQCSCGNLEGHCCESLEVIACMLSAYSHDIVAIPCTGTQLLHPVSRGWNIPEIPLPVV